MIVGWNGKNQWNAREFIMEIEQDHKENCAKRGSESCGDIRKARFRMLYEKFYYGERELVMGSKPNSQSFARDFIFAVRVILFEL